MKITADSHTYDGTGRAGFCPLDPITTQAKTRTGILKAWSKAVTAEYARKLKFQEDYRATVEKLDALAINGVWIAEGYASDSRRRYRFIAAAERGTLVFCGAFDTRDQFPAYRDMCDRIGAIKDKYRTPVA